MEGSQWLRCECCNVCMLAVLQVSKQVTVQAMHTPSCHGKVRAGISV